MYLCTRREIWTSFSCLVLLKCYHVVFSQFKIPANLVQLAVPKMHCLYTNAIVQPSVQHYPCYMACKTKVHTWCRHCHLCINAPMWRQKRWLQGLYDPPSYSTHFLLTAIGWSAVGLGMWNTSSSSGGGGLGGGIWSLGNGGLGGADSEIKLA